MQVEEEKGEKREQGRESTSIREYRMYEMKDEKCFYDSKDNQVMIGLSQTQLNPSCSWLTISINYLNGEEEDRNAQQKTFQIQTIDTVLQSAIRQEQQQQLVIRIDVLKSDGFVLDCMINLLAFVLVTNSISMDDCFSCSSAAISQSDAFILDPSTKEILSASAVLLIVITNNLNNLLFIHYQNNLNKVQFEQFYLKTISAAKQQKEYNIKAIKQSINIQS